METALEKAVLSLSLEDKDVAPPPLILPNEPKNSSSEKNITLSTLNPNSQKRERLLEEDDEQPKKKKNIKIDNPSTTQWISVYNSRPPRKQRYHHNVIDSRLHHHIEKANKDGLFISCVASQANLWALIVDAGTGFTSQVYELSSAFMHKEWIMEQWKNNYFISSIAGADNGSSLIIMSKGTLYIQQSYKVSDSFPFKWINKKWKEGFHVTSMATAKSSCWCVVMSRNSGYSEQVVEFDSFYPSERIRRRWKSGYRITSMAATVDKAAFILSIPKRKITDDYEIAQETLRTFAFPSNHLKEKCSRHMYVSLICYGRTNNGDSNSGRSDDQQREDDVHNALAALQISDETTVIVGDGNFQPIAHVDAVALPSTTLGTLSLEDVLVCPAVAGGTCEGQEDKTTSNIEKST